MISAEMTKARKVRSLPSIGSSPVYNPRHCYGFEFMGHAFIIGVAEGWNAYGLIGTECNGVFLISETNKNFVFTERLRHGMGREHEARQHAEIHRLLNLPDQELQAELVRKDGQELRYDPFEKRVLPTKLTKPLLTEWIKLLQNNHDWHDNDVKGKFLLTGKLICQEIAKAMGFKKKQFTIRVDVAGPACSGDVVLESVPGTLGKDGLYVTLGQSSLGPMWMARTCNGRASGANTWFHVNDLTDVKSLAARLKNLTGV